MALKTQFFLFSATPIVPILLRFPRETSSSSKTFLRCHSHTPQRIPWFHQEEDEEGEWGPPASSFRGRSGAAVDEDDLHEPEEDEGEDSDGSAGGGGGEGEWDPSVSFLSGTAQEGLREAEGDSDGEGGGGGEWDPPVSPPRCQEHHPQEEEEDESEEEGGWELDTSFFLRRQGCDHPEDENSCITITLTMKEILAFARNPTPQNPTWPVFLAGYNGGALSDEECIELMRRMGEYGLALECLHLFQWMQAQGKSPMRVSPRASVVALTVLGRAGMADEVMEMVWSLPSERGFQEAVVYNAAMSGVACYGRYDDAWKVYELMEKNNVQPDHMTSSILLTVMRKSKKSAKNAWEFFQRMNRKGVKWCLGTAGALLNIFCDEGLKKEALIIQSEMEKRGIASNTCIFNSLMTAYSNSNQTEEAEWLFIEMKEKGLQPTVVTYNILMDAYSRRLQPEIVETLLLEMQDLGLRPNARSYDCLISVYGRQKKMSEKAADAFLRMKIAGIKPTSCSYTTLIHAYAVSGLHEKAHITYEDMKREGLKPSIETYTALLGAFSRAGDTEKLIEIWQSMVNENVGSTRVIFHILLDGLAKHGLYVQARDVIYEFGKIGIQPTVMTYNILMNAYARGGQHYKFPQLLKEMTALKLNPDSITYSTMIYAYARARDFCRAFYYHKQMVRSGQMPDARSYRKLRDALDLKAAKKDIKDKSSVMGIVNSKIGIKPKKGKKDEFWKNRKKRYMMTQVDGHQRKAF